MILRLAHDVEKEVILTRLQILAQLNDDLRSRNFKRIRVLFKELEFADISEVFSEFSPEQCIVLFRLIQTSRRSEVFAYLSLDLQEEMLKRLPDIVVASLLNDMEPVDRTRLLEGLTEEIGREVLEKLDPSERDIAEQLLGYPESSIGRLMTPEFVAFPCGMQVREALAYIRWNSSKIPSSLLHHLFVINDKSELMGTIGLPDLVIADPTTVSVDSLMDTTLQSLNVTDSQEKAVDFFRKYDRPYIAIVEASNRLVGIVEADDVFDVAEEDATEEIQQFGGQSTLEDSYFQTTNWVLIQKRAGWLALLFIGMMFTTNALEHFEQAIVGLPHLVFFLPLIISSGGNSGSQIASIIIRGLAVKEVRLTDWPRVLGRELAIGMTLGLVLGVLGFVRAHLSSVGFETGVIVATSLISVVTFGAVLGSMLPFVLKHLGADPAVSSSPAIASISDCVGIILFFNIANLFLDLWK